MPNTAHDIYTQIIKTLPLTEQLRLANLILNDARTARRSYY